jgi:hypothetical protein
MSAPGRVIRQNGEYRIVGAGLRYVTQKQIPTSIEAGTGRNRRSEVLVRQMTVSRLIRWDEKAGLHGMRYAPNNRRARSTRERRPAVKKIITVAKNRNEIFKQQQLTDWCGSGRSNQPLLHLG